MIVLDINPAAQFSPKKKLRAPEWRKFPNFSAKVAIFTPFWALYLQIGKI